MTSWRWALVFVLAAPSAAGATDVPALTGPVTDLANVLSAKERTELAERLLAQENATTNQIVILTVNSLDGEPIEAFAQRVFRAWTLGQEKRDNGVLVLLAVKDRKMRIEVGRGLEGALPDARCAQIIRNEMTPRLRQGKYSEALTAAVTAIDQSVRGEYAAEDEAVNWKGVLWVVGIFGVGLAVMVLLGAVFANRRTPVPALTTAAPTPAPVTAAQPRGRRKGKKGSKSTRASPWLTTPVSPPPPPPPPASSNDTGWSWTDSGGSSGGTSSGDSDSSRGSSSYSGGGGDSGGGGASGNW